MLVHQAFDKMLKQCGIAAKDLAAVTGVSNSRISQFRNGTFLAGKGSDLTSRALDELLTGAQKLNPDAGMVFSLLLIDKNPACVESPDSLNKVVAQGNLRSLIKAATDKEAQEIALALAEKYANSDKDSRFKARNRVMLSLA